MKEKLEIFVATTAVFLTACIVFGAGVAFAQTLVPPPPAIPASGEPSVLNEIKANQVLELQMLVRIQQTLASIQQAQRNRDIQSISPL